MRYYKLAIDSLYLVSLVALSLGIPHECAFEYDSKYLLAENTDVDNESGSDAGIDTSKYRLDFNTTWQASACV